MIRSRLPIKHIIQKAGQIRHQSSSPLQGDAGSKATHLHHKMTTFLAVTTPLYFLAPSDSLPPMADSVIGLALAVNVSAHSWVGMNYVVTDYVPKVSKAMTGPARILTAGLSALTLAGLGKIATNGKGGLKGAVGGLWKKKEE
mmetsp:Transcript_2174/g.2512  ORF Transcript_2174/g.2512 Transcript_2174/m.2512 type:complete len:143 (+) Transcript_2174:46-474(+)|eukprot:CAMPEP_0204613152 /NCGR_PEP_ID=MMETSP0717-20131115/1150_1 /ASSEMBLY_ACC=CAM_ASM_000666 /TAXON_ID=230516 /ORGANISM="Chaetoceros curvisetus" /LENGTH=142 /DNA_ID=CAMNT_0051625473 /DNA_START=14 /DNA_END=442 /DNA_ORIENTATION=+